MAWVSHLAVNVARLTIWLVILGAIFVPLERLFALAPRRRGWAAVLGDLGFYFFNSLVPAMALAVPSALLVTIAHRLLPAGYFAWLDRMPLAGRLAATFVVGEIGFYWGHRWSHQWPWMWRFHAVHHRPEQLAWLMNTRAHPIDMVFGHMCGLVPIYLAGLAGGGAAAGNLPAVMFTLASVIWGFFLHANICWRLRAIDRFVATPRFHHWHHTREDHINRNFASMLPLMDRLFGTLHLPADGAFPREYGVSRRVGIDADGAAVAASRSDPGQGLAKRG